ncbi:tail fiber protein [Arsenophonus nasoniae]|uniref:Tail fiber protein n=1 Tax=Arsenophonus nasoniae TaxID=638 RepID=A0AA95GUY3_9GAMM|nr:tail fiber protein [Arsenophonus nasoniae]WGM00497.1 tail fiber protein [Arsenophonus nasoniae]
MPKNEILPFAIADGANVLPADEYQKLPARNNGFSAGVARSQELNKVWRQASVIAHVVAQFIAETNNSDVLDDGNVDKLKAGLISALSKNVNNTVPAATKTVAGITKLSSATNSNDETLAATPKAVKLAYDLAKTVSIDEINKKLDKAGILQTTGNATDKVMSQDAVTKALQNAVNINTLYPVGVVIWFAQNKNPNTLFPDMKWQYLGENKTIRLAKADGSNVFTTGGSDAIKLTEAQLPAHGHPFSATTSSYDYGTKNTNETGEHVHNYTNKSGSKRASGDAWNVASGGNVNATTSSSGNHAHNLWLGPHTHTVSGTTGKAGGASEINITNAFVTLMG